MESRVSIVHGVKVQTRVGHWTPLFVESRLAQPQQGSGTACQAGYAGLGHVHQSRPLFSVLYCFIVCCKTRFLQLTKTLRGVSLLCLFTALFRTTRACLNALADPELQNLPFDLFNVLMCGLFP